MGEHHYGDDADSGESGTSGAGDIAGHPNTLCFVCGGFGKLSEPRIYVVQASSELITGTTMAQWRDCPQCHGKGYFPGLWIPA